HVRCSFANGNDGVAHGVPERGIARDLSVKGGFAMKLNAELEHPAPPQRWRALTAPLSSLASIRARRNQVPTTGEGWPLWVIPRQSGATPWACSRGQRGPGTSDASGLGGMSIS